MLQHSTFWQVMAPCCSKHGGGCWAKVTDGCQQASVSSAQQPPPCLEQPAAKSVSGSGVDAYMPGWLACCLATFYSKSCTPHPPCPAHVREHIAGISSGCVDGASMKWDLLLCIPGNTAFILCFPSLPCPVLCVCVCAHAVVLQVCLLR